ncbi:MAG TPA: hypothetical protein VHB46_12860 [Burkholderiales bacterium]|nr:hypothetical protein [Burkholderiales bacterium]
MKKIQRDALLADQAAVRSILAEMHEGDVAGRSSFTSRLADIERRLAQLGEVGESIGSIALFFAGDPVVGSRSIDADFASKTIKVFQELVTKTIASEERGELGERGPLPLRTPTALAVTDVVRGSFGFILEEGANNASFADSAVKIALDQVTDVLAKTAAEDEEQFESAVETLDPRLLVSLRTFFRTLDDSHAAMRIVEDEREEVLNAPAIRRGRLRVDEIHIVERDVDNIVGELIGLVPLGKRFEMRLQDTGQVIRGSVRASLAQQYMSLIEEPDEKVVGRTWMTKMRIREINERNKPPRLVYSLLGLIRQLPDEE